MGELELKIGCADYEHVRPLLDGTVTIEGAAAQFETARIVTEVFERMIRRREFDVAELGLTYFLRTLDLEEPPFLAIPVFPNRCFRHSAIYVNRASGIARPQDLAGKTVGEFAVYGHDAGVWPKGILADEYGVKPDQCRWVVGGLDWPLAPIDFIPRLHPAGVTVTEAAAGTDLGRMLEAGEIDALISADVPKCVLDGSPKVGRLFPDYEVAERDYYRRTGIFPIMHTLVIRRSLVAERPGLAQAVYRGFQEAKKIVAKRYREGLTFNNMTVMVPWLSRLLEENTRLLGDDWWPYGVEANRAAINTFLRYHFEQGLSERRLTCEDIFAPELLGT